MAEFTTLTSRIVPLPVENIDTDQIIPARYLKATDKSGMGDALFAEPAAEFGIESGQLIKLLA